LKRPLFLLAIKKEFYMAKLSKRDITYLIEESLFESMSFWGSGKNGRFFEGEDIIWTYTGTKTMNQISGALFKAAEIEAKIYRTLKIFRGKNVPVEWICGPSTKPYDLGEYLEKHGLSLTGKWTGMAMEMSAGIKKAEIPEGVAIKQVDSKDDDKLKQWIDIVVKSFGGWNDDDRQGMHMVLRDAADTGKDRDFIKFMASYNNIPCSTGAICTGPEATGIYFAATLPEYRGKGIGAALMGKMLEAAADKGNKLVVLHATKEGEPLYKKLGFRQYCEFEVYGSEGYAS